MISRQKFDVVDQTGYTRRNCVPGDVLMLVSIVYLYLWNANKSTQKVLQFVQSLCITLVSTGKLQYIFLFQAGSWRSEYNVPRCLKPILHTTQRRDSMRLTLSLVSLIGLARRFNNSCRLIELFCSMSLRIFDPFLTHWVLFCIHTLCPISVHWLLMCYMLYMGLVH